MTSTSTFDSVVAGAPHALSGEEIELIDPSRGVPFARTRLADPADIDEAVDAARVAYETSWRDIAPVDKGRALLTMASKVREAADRLAAIEMQNTGHPAGFAAADVETAARYLEYYAGLADKIHGKTIPLGPDFVDYTVREPWGVCAVITPFNAPFQMAMRSVAPALASGNTVVLKPTEQAPAPALALAQVLAEAGLPAGVLNVLPGAAEAGQRLVTHRDVSHVTFTGSVMVGSAIMAAAASNVTPVTLELGGKSPQVIFADADLDAAVAAIMRSSVLTAGQVCSAGTRILVDRSVRRELTERLAAAIGDVTLGVPQEGAQMGPLVSKTHQERVLDAIRSAASDANLVTGGAERAAGVPEGGYFVRPTVFDDVAPSSRLAQEEIFGPVLAIIEFSTDDEALQIANGTDFGLVSGVWTRDIARALRFARSLASGQVFVNNYGSGGGIELPFGGYRRSGIGREKGADAVLEYTQLKNVCIRID